MSTEIWIQVNSPTWDLLMPNREQNFPTWLKNLKPLAVWDDHDYGLNDGGSEYTLKKEAQKLFLDFWNIDIKDERHKREGIYFSENRQIKDKKILLIGLDTRYFRSPLEGEKRNYESTSDISKTILGKEQWEWLERYISRGSWTLLF